MNLKDMVQVTPRLGYLIARGMALVWRGTSNTPWPKGPANSLFSVLGNHGLIGVDVGCCSSAACNIQGHKTISLTICLKIDPPCGNRCSDDICATSIMLQRRQRQRRQQQRRAERLARYILVNTQGWQNLENFKVA